MKDRVFKNIFINLSYLSKHSTSGIAVERSGICVRVEAVVRSSRSSHSDVRGFSMPIIFLTMYSATRL